MSRKVSNVFGESLNHLEKVVLFLGNGFESAFFVKSYGGVMFVVVSRKHCRPCVCEREWMTLSIFLTPQKKDERTFRFEVLSNTSVSLFIAISRYTFALLFCPLFLFGLLAQVFLSPFPLAVELEYALWEEILSCSFVLIVTLQV